MGGCLAWELKQRRLAKSVIGYNRSAARRRFAKQKGFCDETYADPVKAVMGADLVVFATPVQQIPLLAQEIAPALSPGTLLTDLGSTKERLVKALSKILPKDCDYVGGHPMAGTENSGIESAIPNLFQDRWWFFTPHQKTQGAWKALKRLEGLAKALGAKPKFLTPREHDALLARISHFPQLVASSLMESTRSYQKGRALKYAAGGFRDTTRVAASPPQMWTEICLDNAPQILKSMREFEKIFQTLKKNIASGDQRKLKSFFEQVSKARQSIDKVKKG